jgi:hypothetical protein
VEPCNWVLVCVSLTLVGSAAVAQNPDWDSLGKQWWSHIQFLAGDNLEGRDTGSRGFEKAADYMAGQFRAAGLEPAGVDGYRQPMDFHVVQIDETRCALDLLREGKAQPLKLGDDAVLGVSSHAAENVEAGAVFVGYGLTVPELHYDDLAGQDVKGKIVVFLTGGPADMSGPVKAHYQSSEERRKALRKSRSHRHHHHTESQERRGALVAGCRVPVPATDGIERSRPRRPASTPGRHPIQPGTC